MDSVLDIVGLTIRESYLSIRESCLCIHESCLCMHSHVSLYASGHKKSNRALTFEKNPQAYMKVREVEILKSRSPKN